MSTSMGRFTISLDGGDKQTVMASRLDYIVLERELKQPIYKAIEQGFLEPVLRLAWQAARRQGALPEDVDFDAFLERCDVVFETDEDDEAAPGND